MRRLFILIALVAGALSPAAGVVAVPVPASDADHAGIGVRLVDAPVATRDDPRARVYIIDHVAPGALVERRVEVSNNSGEAAQVKVYAAGATITSGAFVGLPGTSPNDVSTWIGLDHQVLDLQDAATSMVDVTIRVPVDAAPGEHYAAIWAQTSSRPGSAEGVTQVNRVGIRVYLSVGPGGTPASEFMIESLTPARDPSGHPVVQAVVRNTGGRALDLSGSLNLSDGPGGLSAGPFPVVLGTTLAIGETEPVTIKLDKQLPDGPWRAKVRVTSGLLTHRAEASITFPEHGVGHSVHTEASRGAWWWIGLAVLGVVLLVLLWWWRARRHVRRPVPGARRRTEEARTR